MEWADAIADQFRADGAAAKAAYLKGGAAALEQSLRASEPAWAGLLTGLYAAVAGHAALGAVREMVRPAPQRVPGGAPGNPPGGGRSGNTPPPGNVIAGSGGTPPGGTQYPWRERAVKWMQENAARKVTQMSDHTKMVLRKVIANGMQQGMRRPDIAEDIQAAFEHWGGLDSDTEIAVPRAMNIARTEVATAANWGRQEGVKDEAERLGLRAMKTWVTMHDKRVRTDDEVANGVGHTSLDGETVPLDQPYSNGLMHPGDPHGPADQVCGCRCYEIYKAE